MQKTYIDLAQEIVYKYVVSRLEKTNNTDFGLSDVYIVWFFKTLQNWEALVTTTVPDVMYYKVTFNGDKGEVYLDVYKKFDNVCIVLPTS